jgi:hypothetical protein
MRARANDRRNDTPAPPAGGARLLKRSCACGKSAAGGECSACREARERGQAVPHAAVLGGPSARAAGSVDDALAAPGRPLDAATRRLMEARFGQDFGRVRVHTDRAASDSARAEGADAFTSGDHVVFAEGRYAPTTAEGLRLLAHELTHVTQQGLGHARAPASPAGSAVWEAEAQANADRVARGAPAVVLAPAPAGAVQRQPSKPDKTATDIIDAAQDTSKPIADRAVAVVKAIIDAYYAADKAKVKNVVFDATLPAGFPILVTESTQDATTKAWAGTIHVSQKFVEDTTKSSFARRVLQVGHEIEHVDQHTKGMGGAGKEDEREFLAFYHEALAPEKSATGRVAHSMRVDLMDTALGYYYCLGTAEQAAHTTEKDDLLVKRADEIKTIKAKGFVYTEPPVPTSCKRPAYVAPKPVPKSAPTTAPTAAGAPAEGKK